MTITNNLMIEDKEEVMCPSHCLSYDITISLDKDVLKKTLPDSKVQMLIDKLMDMGCGRNSCGVEDDEYTFNFFPPEDCYSSLLYFLNGFDIDSLLEDEEE